MLQRAPGSRLKPMGFRLALNDCDRLVELAPRSWN